MFDLQEFEKQKQKILKDERYSKMGKEEALAKLESKYKAEARKAVKDLRKDAIVNALKLRDAQAKRIKKTNEELAKIDYGRLNYETQAIQSKIKAARGITDIVTIWENAKRANDAYVIKAWKDTSQGLINEKFGEENYTNLKGNLFEDINATPTEIAKVEISEDELKAGEALKKIEAEANEINGAYGTGRSVVKRVFDGIGFEDGKAQLNFDYGIHALSEKQETPSEVAYRLEREYQKAIEEYKNNMAEKGFGDDIDEDFDDLRGVFVRGN